MERWTNWESLCSPPRLPTKQDLLDDCRRVLESDASDEAVDMLAETVISYPIPCLANVSTVGITVDSIVSNIKAMPLPEYTNDIARMIEEGGTSQPYGN